MTYGDNTYNSPNMLIRFAHRSRMKTAKSLIPIMPGQLLLDYGCGDGVFLASICSEFAEPHSFAGFEPLMQARDSELPIYRDWREVAAHFSGNLIDIVTCFEVLEHLPKEQQRDALEKMRATIKTSGKLVVSVPIECGFPSIVKNTFRSIKFGKAQVNTYNVKNLLKSALGYPIPECRSGSTYLNHMGFYFFDLEREFLRYFEIEKRLFSPFPYFSFQLNSQVFYVLRPI